MSTNWEELKTVLCLERCGSLSSAAEELGVNYTTIARRIARLETDMGVVLFEKMANGYLATEAGLLVAKHVATMENSEHALMREMQGRDETLSGPFVVTAPQLLISNFLTPVIDTFCTKHPNIDLRVRATNDLLNLNHREADLAIRVSRSPGDTLKGLRLTQQDSTSFGNADWAERIKTDSNAMIDWVVYDKLVDIPKIIRNEYPNSRIRMRFDDMVALMGAAQSGLGLVNMPMFLGRSTPDLVQIPLLPPQPYADIWVVAHPDVWPSAKAKAFREILVAEFKSRRSIFVA
jgi:DNA-binding transcriptional LysR family regulator